MSKQIQPAPAKRRPGKARRRGELGMIVDFWKTQMLRRGSLLRMTRRYGIVILSASEESTFCSCPIHEAGPSPE